MNRGADFLLESCNEAAPDLFEILIEGVEDGFLVIAPNFGDLVPLTEAMADPEAVLKKLRGKDWSTAGRSLTTILGQIDPRFINHEEHKHRLLHGGKRPDGTPYPGGGGLRWGGLAIKDKEALLRVMGSFEYGDKQEIYQQVIRFANFQKIARAKGISWPDKASLLMRDRIKIHCDCAAFRYYHAHAATKKGFSLYPELRPAKQTNPENKGGICKHLDVVLKNLPAQVQSIASDMKAWHDSKAVVGDF